MEPATRFDLEAAIQTWRAHLSEELAGQADALAELEEHLRTSVAALRQTGLSDEESLLIAQRRLGSAPKLGAEFRQSNPATVWRCRALWIAIGGIGIHLWSLISTPLRHWVALGIVDASAAQRAVFTIASLAMSVAPLMLAILLAKGKLSPLLLRIRPLFITRGRAVTSLTLLIALTTGVGMIANLYAMPGNAGLQWAHLGMGVAAVCTWSLPLGLLIGWLLPPSSRATAELRRSRIPN